MQRTIMTVISRTYTWKFKYFHFISTLPLCGVLSKILTCISTSAENSNSLHAYEKPGNANGCSTKYHPENANPVVKLRQDSCIKHTSLNTCAFKSMTQRVHTVGDVISFAIWCTFVSPWKINICWAKLPLHGYYYYLLVLLFVIFHKYITVKRRFTYY